MSTIPGGHAYHIERIYGANDPGVELAVYRLGPPIPPSNDPTEILVGELHWHPGATQFTSDAQDPKYDPELEELMQYIWGELCFCGSPFLRLGGKTWACTSGHVLKSLGTP
jgi:hypothetical protein